MDYSFVCLFVCYIILLEILLDSRVQNDLLVKSTLDLILIIISTVPRFLANEYQHAQIFPLISIKLIALRQTIFVELYLYHGCIIYCLD